MMQAFAKSQGMTRLARTGLASFIHQTFVYICDKRGATTLEYALLLAAIALPCALIFRWALQLLLYQYTMMSMMISLPFP